ncbi:MAG: pyruvate kinase [Candidatus Paceibacteria bacterium]|jgi:pyruvate kinase
MTTKKKTKIVATIGPKTESEEMLSKLIKGGLNVIRLNFSHGDFAEHQNKIDNGRKASKKLGIPVAFLQDLGGPKIRIGTFGDDPDQRITLKKGQTFTLSTKQCIGTDKKVFVSYTKLPKEIKVGGKILLDDGKKELKVTNIKGTDITTKVIIGGDTKGRRGVNLPDAELTISSLTKKDREDLKFGIDNKVDFIALSFVRKPKDISDLRIILEKAGSKAGIIAKIETPQAIAAIDEIIELSDGIMVARGDLAIEVPAEEVPLLQKMIIRKCNRAGIPVITATQMLESMISSPVPTRAEVSDIANAILDGTDAIMLSEETTLGEYPLESVEVMDRVSRRVESDYLREQLLIDEIYNDVVGIGSAVTSGAVYTADEVGADHIVCLTETGYSARMVSRYKPYQDIHAFTPTESTFQKLILNFGVTPVAIKRFKSLEDVLKTVQKHFLDNKIANKGDKIVVVSGWPFGKSVESNIIAVETL